MSGSGSGSGSSSHAASPFGALVAALHDVNIKGTDDPDIPLAQDVLDGMVAEPELVRLAAYIKDNFKFGDSNETLSDKRARNLANIAAIRLNGGAGAGAGTAAGAAPTGPKVVLSGKTVPHSLAHSLPFMTKTSFSEAKPQVAVDTKNRCWSSWEDGQWLTAAEPPPHARASSKRPQAAAPDPSASGAKKPRLEGVVATAAASASSNAADDANKGMPETKHSDGPQEVPSNNRMPAPPSSSHVPAAFAPFIRSVLARLAPPTIRSGAGGAAGAGATSVADVRAGNEDQQDGGRAFFDTTVAKWKDGAGSTAAGCMLRYVQEKRRRHADILQAATRVAAEIARAPRTQTPRGDRVVAMAIAHLSTAVQLGLDADRLVQIAQTTTCELTTECLLNSCVVRQAFIHFPATICGNSLLRRALCRTRIGDAVDEAVAEIVQKPDTFLFDAGTAACHILHEAKPVNASNNEVEEDTAKLIVTSAGLAGAVQLSINESVEMEHSPGPKPQKVKGSECQCFYPGHQEMWMPFPCIQTVGAEFRLYAGKTFHDVKHHGACKHHVYLLCRVDMGHTPVASTLACTALVQSCAWELSARLPQQAAALVPDYCVFTSKASRRDSGSRSNKPPSNHGSDGNIGSGGKRHGDASSPGSNTGPQAGTQGGRQHMGEHGLARLGRGVYAAGTPKLEDLLALDATGLFGAPRPMMVGIPTLGGPSPSAIESEDDSRARVYTARHLDSELEVVIKVLPAEHGSHEAATLRRVNMCARARSVRLVDVVKVGDDKVALVLERAPYMFPLLATRALQQFKQLCEAIEAWHEVGFLHLDIKPGNVALDAGGGVVVLDAGHARKMTRGAVPVSHGHGTPGFVAPELFADDTPAVATAACDVFSLGKMLQYLLDRGICSEHFDSLLQLAQRMTNPKPELRPVLSEVVRVIAANGASRAGGLALDGSQIGAVAGKNVRPYAGTSPTGGSSGAVHGTGAVA